MIYIGLLLFNCYINIFIFSEIHIPVIYASGCVSISSGRVGCLAVHLTSEVELFWLHRVCINIIYMV
jgi:hypothetical protein